MSSKRKAPENGQGNAVAKKGKVEVAEGKDSSSADIKYLVGFGYDMSTEALPGALPLGQTNPQKCPYGLYAEQISGTSFTTPRAHNLRTWFYRITPAAKHEPFVPCEGAEANPLLISDFADQTIDPSQMRWKPLPFPEQAGVDWVRGLATVGGSGGPETKAGFAVHLYSCNASMEKSAFVNSDGDFLIVPQVGTLRIMTEMGRLDIKPREIVVIPRGIKFRVAVDGPSRGYVCEVFNGHFDLPELGPIGANGLANPRDFESPTAHYEDEEVGHTLIQKFCGKLFKAKLSSSPFDVVAWFGNYAPFKYALDKFCAINSVSFDHLDPSIFTVLTCPTSDPGVACLDFVIFPPRWTVQDHTFRPPYYHRNCMTEYMGNIEGKYEAKPDGFLPGGGSLHSCMVGHGPDADSFKKHSEVELKPFKIPDTDMAFMFESTYVMKLTKFAARKDLKIDSYYKCWEGLPRNFDPNNIDA